MSTLAKLLMGVGEEVAPTVPDEPGTPYGGGFYVGRFQITSGSEYALVVSPKAQGEAFLQWKTTNTETGAYLNYDGWTTTQIMVQAGSALHPAAAFCWGLDINGFDDWYLPSLNELEIIYRAFKPTTQNNFTSSGENPSAIPPTGGYTLDNPSQTNIDVFKEGGEEAFEGTYWTSSEFSSSGSRNQRFSDGSQGTVSNKTTTFQVRAVRRVVIKE